jgi:hypothetical protein
MPVISRELVPLLLKANTCLMASPWDILPKSLLTLSNTIDGRFADMPANKYREKAKHLSIIK